MTSFQLTLKTFQMDIPHGHNLLFFLYLHQIYI